MGRILLVYTGNDMHGAFIEGLYQEKNTDVLTVHSGSQGLDCIKNNDIDLAVVAENLPDMTGFHFVEKMVNINPFVNTAIFSNLENKAFHEATEGLGVLMSFPKDADETEALKLMNYLKQVTA